MARVRCGSRIAAGGPKGGGACHDDSGEEEPAVAALARLGLRVGGEGGVHGGVDDRHPVVQRAHHEERQQRVRHVVVVAHGVEPLALPREPLLAVQGPFILSYLSYIAFYISQHIT